jgi:heptosyltransferase I
MDSGLKIDLNKDAPSEILIVKLSAIGDVVHTLPFLDVLHQNFPRAKIDWLVEEGAAGIIEGHPAIRRVIISKRKSWQRNLGEDRRLGQVFREVLSFRNDLRQHRYDWVIDLQGLLKSGVLVWFSRGDRKVGMSGAREGAWLFLKEPSVRVNYEQHAIDRYLEVAGHLDCEWDRWDGRIPVSETNGRSVDQMLSDDGFDGGNLVAINPMARWETKLWEPELFATLADRILQDFSGRIVFTGSKDDRPIIDNIASNMKHRPLNFAGRTRLKELASLYDRCRLLVTTDTGPMHMAAAMGCPVVALFGPTSPLRTGPYGSKHRVMTSGAACGPCFKKTCHEWSCMRDITVERVHDAVKQVLSREESSEPLETRMGKGV